MSGSSDAFREEAPTAPDHPLVACPACRDEGHRSTGEQLTQLPSGTWVRVPCDWCLGVTWIDREDLQRYRALDAGDR